MESCNHAIKSEIDALYNEKRWVLVPRSQAKNLLRNKWIFRKKDGVAPDGNTYVKYKARLVTRGFQQLQRTGYAETVVAVLKFTTLRLFLAVVATDNPELHQRDVKTAFLNGDVSEDIFIYQPEGLVDFEYPDHVCKLLKAH